MVCNNCGQMIEDGLKFCTNCGTPAPISSPSSAPAPSPSPAPAPAPSPSPAPKSEPVSVSGETVVVSDKVSEAVPEKTMYTKRALWCLILGVVSLFTCCFGEFTAIASIILGIIDLADTKKANVMNILGIVLSSIAMVMSVISMIVIFMD